jgi:hypothetical protein
LRGTSRKYSSGLGLEGGVVNFWVNKSGGWDSRPTSKPQFRVGGVKYGIRKPAMLYVVRGSIPVGGVGDRANRLDNLSATFVGKFASAGKIGR